MTGRFAGRTVVVTGGAAGIGAATVRRLTDEGAAVVAVDLTPVSTGAASVVGDVAEEQTWQLIRAAAAEPVDGLVCNAAVNLDIPADKLSLVDWRRQVDVCLTAAFLGVRALLPDLRATRGSVVLVSSVHAHVGVPGHPAYAAAKGGLVALGRQLAVEYGPDVRVNTVSPGPVDTAAWAGLSTEDIERSARATVAGRLGRPDEIAAAIAFLLDRESGFITGTELVVDGGWTARRDSA